MFMIVYLHLREQVTSSLTNNALCP